MAAEWYVQRNEKKLGPFSNKDLRRLVAAGKLTSGDMLWKEGLPEWVAASRVESLCGNEASVSTQSLMSASAATPTGPASSQVPADFANEEPSESDFESADLDNEELPPLPASAKRASGRDLKATGAARHSLANRLSDKDSTDWICWWLRFYARVNFGLSLVVSIPMLLFGIVLVMMSLVGMAGSVVSEVRDVPLAGGLVFGMGLASSVTYITFSLLLFMFMNVFTLTCAWGAEVLELLKGVNAECTTP